MIINKNESLKKSLQEMQEKHPSAGYYERMLLVAGYTQTSIEEMVKEYQDENVSREDVCEGEVDAWAYNQ